MIHRKILFLINNHIIIIRAAPFNGCNHFSPCHPYSNRSCYGRFSRSAFQLSIQRITAILKNTGSCIYRLIRSKYTYNQKKCCNQQKYFICDSIYYFTHHFTFKFKLVFLYRIRNTNLVVIPFTLCSDQCQIKVLIQIRNRYIKSIYILCFSIAVCNRICCRL